MRRAQPLLLLCLSAASLVCLVEAQTTGGFIKRTPESAEQTRRSERRVTLDVQVRDSSGKPVSGLGQQDLTLLDNGHPQALTSFREIDGSAVPAPTEAVVLLDTMDATPEDVVIERQGIDQFLRQDGGHLALPVSIVFLTDTVSSSYGLAGRQLISGRPQKATDADAGAQPGSGCGGGARAYNARCAPCRCSPPMKRRSREGNC